MEEPQKTKKRVFVEMEGKLNADLERFVKENGGSKVATIICALRLYLSQTLK